MKSEQPNDRRHKEIENLGKENTILCAMSINKKIELPDDWHWKKINGLS